MPSPKRAETSPIALSMPMAIGMPQIFLVFIRAFMIRHRRSTSLWQFDQGRGLALFVPSSVRAGNNGACNTEATTSRLVPQLMHRHAAPLM
jgi:hypothetical protein